MKSSIILSLALVSMLFFSCGEDEIPGCTDPSSDNYNSEANLDDGSCFIAGCTDPNASNYNPDATENGEICLYPGCTDENCDQYDETANDDDGSCSTYFERWTGNYSGDFDCTGLLADYVGDATLSFSKRDIDDNLDSMDVSLEFSLSEMPLSFSTVITRDSMYASAEFFDIAVDTTLFDGLPVTIDMVNLDINGVLGINESNSTIEGSLTIFVEEVSSGFGFSDSSTCFFVGTRQ